MSKTKISPGLSEIDQLCVDTIRLLSVEGVQKANSGHPGITMGMAPASYVLWSKIMKYTPDHPDWANRDRFILSAGHGSMLLYSLLHLAGYDISLDDLKNFRQTDSKTPGHPEYDPELGIEVTTGPLGQGLSNGVGMAIAEKYLAEIFNKDGFDIIDYDIFAVSGDGCLQEGISSEASSLAGHLGLDNLILIYDDNHITIDGETDLSFSEDVGKRYEAYGWYVQEIGGDGNDMEAFQKAIENAKNEKSRPSMIKLRTHIGYGSPNKQDTAGAHGAPLGDDEIKLTKKNFGFDPEKKFFIPEEVKEQMNKVKEKNQQTYRQWQELFDKYAQKYPKLAKQFKNMQEGKLGVDIDKLLPKFEAGDSIATRKASGKVLDSVMPELPMILGGSADLTPSNKTLFEGAESFSKENRKGRYVRYGVREHAMGAVMNGIAVSKMVRPYGGTFLVFSDYMRGAIRLAAMSKYPTIFVLTHDSIGVGEDGPTHQPVEHAASLRAIPNLRVFRPADANETVQAWKFILEHKDDPAAILLTRQGLPVLDQNKYASAENLEKGAYTLVKQDNPDVLLLASGSEVSLALCAAEGLEKEGIKAQVVSMPCWEIFEQQSAEYKESVLPSNVKARIGIEAGVRLGWDKWLGTEGKFIGMDSFGVSGPQNEVFEKFGITVENVIKTAKESLGK